MSAINQVVHTAFYVLLALSGITLLFLIVLLARRVLNRGEYQVPKAIATWAGICTAVGSFAISVVNFNFPIGILPDSDPAAETIRNYYEAIQDRRCDDAWSLIHTARKNILKDDFHFGRDQFCAAYATTQTYQNLEILREDKPGLLSSRLYRVAYDVEDVLVRNNLYDLRLKDFADVVRSGPWDATQLTNEIVENLKLYYVVPDDIVPLVKELIGRTPFWYVGDPEMIGELKRLLALRYKIMLADQAAPPQTRHVNRHYVHSLTLSLDDGMWKIRDGLAAPLLVAPYVPRDKLL